MDSRLQLEFLNNFDIDAQFRDEKWINRGVNPSSQIIQSVLKGYIQFFVKKLKARLDSCLPLIPKETEGLLMEIAGQCMHYEMHEREFIRDIMEGICRQLQINFDSRQSHQTIEATDERKVVIIHCTAKNKKLKVPVKEAKIRVNCPHCSEQFYVKCGITS